MPVKVDGSVFPSTLVTVNGIDEVAGGTELTVVNDDLVMVPASFVALIV